MLVHRRLSALCAAAMAAVAALAAVAAPGPARADDPEWGPLQEAGGSTLAVALADGTTALISVGGPDDATIYDQRRTAAGTLGPGTEVTTVGDAESCRPVEAVTALANVAVAVECQATTGLEDPPTRLVELVWTGDDGWVSHVQPEGELGSLDYSPRGQYVVFTSNSRYGRPHRVTSYHADLGWRDLERRELGSSGGDLVAAINDGGNLVALRGAGFEDEPGYWFGGRLRIETYDDTTGRWTHRFTRAYRDGGIDPYGIDLAAGRILATVVQSRSTGEVNGRADRVVLLSGRPGSPRFWSSPRWSRQVLTASAATTRSGLGVAAWQAVGDRRTARPWFATWAPHRARPSVHDLKWRTDLTDAAVFGRAMDLSVSANGHGAIAYVRHRPGVDHSTVAATSFRLGPHGGLRRQIDATWQQPVTTTLDVTASTTSTSVTLGRMAGPFYPSPLTRYSLGP
ncbi:MULTISPECIES: hypothetical protein [unclassified Nocardioides]|uniref:hypothetical protein n=1 Tax=unclassified Nocardioides TaxID=2615069 RepID=UPI0036100C3F